VVSLNLAHPVYYGKYPVNTLPGIYQVFTWVFSRVFTSFASQLGLGIYLGTQVNTRSVLT